MSRSVPDRTEAGPVPSCRYKPGDCFLWGFLQLLAEERVSVGSPSWRCWWSQPLQSHSHGSRSRQFSRVIPTLVPRWARWNRNLTSSSKVTCRGRPPPALGCYIASTGVSLASPVDSAQGISRPQRWVSGSEVTRPSTELGPQVPVSCVDGVHVGRVWTARCGPESWRRQVARRSSCLARIWGTWPSTLCSCSTLILQGLMRDAGSSPGHPSFSPHSPLPLLLVLHLDKIN